VIGEFRNRTSILPDSMTKRATARQTGKGFDLHTTWGMRGFFIYPVVALLSTAWPSSASPAASASITVPAGMCEIEATTAASLLLREDGSPVVLREGPSQGLEEALRSVAGRATRWIEAPSLLVLTSVMDYQSGVGTEYQATADRLSDEETNALIADLTAALTVLTGGTFTDFAEVRLESTPTGATTSAMRPGHIVVGRYRGVRDRLNTIGVGGRFRSGRAIKAGTVFLDADYDRSSSRRALLRTHELGHALGYDHVDSRPSIMNPRIGAEITEYDRRAALVAFREEAASAPSCPLL